MRDVVCSYLDVRENQLFLDELPDDSGHLITVHLHHGLGHLDSGIGGC